MSKKQVYPKTTEQDIVLMEKLLTEGNLAYEFAVRVRTVLYRVQKQPTAMIAEILHSMPTTVSQYVKRFNGQGVKGLISNKTHKHGKAPISEKLKNEICTVVCTEKPKGATHWICRMLAKRFGISDSTVNVILRDRKLKLHLE